MDKLYHIIKGLTAYEIEFVRNLYHSRTTGSSKKLKLFNLVESDTCQTDQEASALIYGQQPGSKFSQLKKRLKEDLLNILLVQANGTGEDNDPVAADITSRRLLLQGKILLQRGLQEEALDLFRKALQIAERFEFSDLRIVIYDLLRSEAIPDIQQKLIGIYSDKIAQSMTDQKVMMEAEAIHYELINNKDSSKSGSLEGIFESLRFLCRQSSSKKSEWWCTMAELQFFKDIKAYRKAVDNGKKLLDLLLANPRIGSNDTRKKILLEMGRLSIYVGEYNNAIGYAREGLNYYERDDVEILDPMEVIYFGCMKTSRPDEAIHITNEALKSSRKYATLHTKWMYYLAQLKFRLERFTESIALINTKCVLSRNQPQLNFGVRTLDLLNTIELNEYDWMDFKLDSYRKLLNRNKNNSMLHHYQSIYKVLSSLAKRNYNFSVTEKSEAQTLNLLKESANKNSQWEIMGYELISFTDWFDSKVTGQQKISLLTH